MIDAPERIWLLWRDHPPRGRFAASSMDHGDDGFPEYRRADRPPTLAEALALPEIAALVALLEEAKSDIASYVEAEYPLNAREAYPSIKRRYERDMGLCRQIAAALAAMKEAGG